MKPKDEYLYYIQKFLDLSQNIKEEQLKKDIIYAFFNTNRSLCELANFDIESLKN